MSSFACMPLTYCILCNRNHHSPFYCLAPFPARDAWGVLYMCMGVCTGYGQSLAQRDTGIQIGICGLYMSL